MKQLLSTKFYIPRPAAGLLLRPRLLRIMDEGCKRKLTLISASAGFGKSSLLSQWAGAAAHPVAWLSLDANDNDPFQWLDYLVGAIQNVNAEIGLEAREILHSSQAPPFDMILTRLINEVAGIPERFTLILDDYHFIEEDRVHRWISFLLGNLPRNMHLVISTRHDPPLPLARMRAGRELVEIRSNDLRLSPDETARLLNEVLGFHLSADAVRSLDTYVEGWAAGLQLVALSMQGRDDLDAYIEAFEGQNRFILDYLMEEVLGRQTEETRRFLLSTSILERLNASLCDALLEKEESQQILSRLEQTNAFLVPLDNERNWYRYHHLFADLLQNQLKMLAPEQTSRLHSRASGWYDRAGLYTQAISHALNGKDFDRAASLYEKYGLTVMSLNQEKNLAGWLDLLPVEVIRSRPWLCILEAWLHYSVGTRAKAEEFLQIAEQWAGPPPRDPAALPERERRRLKGAIASIRAHLSIVDRDFQAVLEHVDLAFDNLPDEDPRRSTAMVALGLAYWALGKRNESEETFAEASALFRRNDNWDGLVSSLCYRGMMQAKRGHLQPAFATYQEALRAATRPDGTKILFAAIPFLRLGDVMREWNDLAGSQEMIASGLNSAGKLNHPDVLIEACICQARLLLARKNPAGTLSALHQADRIRAENQVDPWYTGWLDEAWLRYWLSVGDLAAAASRVESSGLTLEGPLDYHHDLHHTNLARVLLARGAQDPSGNFLENALQLLDRLQDAAEKADWVHEKIKILVLQGLVLWTSRKKQRSVKTLARALRLAEPGGYVRMFIDEGAPMEEMLGDLVAQIPGAQAVDRQILTYASRLLEALKNERTGLAPANLSGNTAMIEPLSDRELQVLRYLNSHLSGTEIARELGISANTVRFHIKNIYSKLHVNRRSDAVNQGKELGIL